MPSSATGIDFVNIIVPTVGYLAELNMYIAT